MELSGRLRSLEQAVQNDLLTAAAVAPQFGVGHEEDAQADEPLQRLILSINA